MVNKALEYRRALFLDDTQNLEALIRQASAALPTQAHRTVTKADGTSITLMRSDDYGARGFAIYCGSYVDQQPVGTIPMAPAPQVNLGVRQPPEGENFVNRGFVAYVWGNHVVCMDCGRNGGSLRNFLADVFLKARFPDAARQFQLIRVANVGALETIGAVGVSGVDLRVAISEATAVDLAERRAGDGFWDKAIRAIGDAVSAITADDEDLQPLSRSEHGNVTVSINVKEKDLEAAKDALDQFATEVATDEDAESYVIRLRDGNKITPDELSVRRYVRLERHANYINVADAWEAMGQFMSQLEERGYLEV